MGATIPLNIAPQNVAPLSTTASSPSVTLPTVLTSLPPSLASLPRPITLSGTLFDLMPDASFFMKTSMGPIQLAVTQAQGELFDALKNMFNTPTGSSGKVELVIQPGTPPKEATLLLPKQDKVESLVKLETAQQTRAVSEGVLLCAPKGKNGEPATLKVTVLPDKIDLPTMGKAEQVVKADTNDLPKFLTRVIHPDENAPTLTQSKGQASSATPQSSTNAPTLQSITKLDVGQSYRLKISKTLPPSDPFPSTEMAAHEVRATVVAKSLTGQTILRTESDQTLFIHDKGNLPIGTKIVAQAQLVEDDPLTLLPQGNDRDFLPLRGVVETLQSISPQGAAAFLHARAPTPAHHFAATTMFLLSALQSGKIDEWLGPAAKYVLETENKGKAKAQLIDALQESLNATPQDRTVGEWKAYPIPLHYQGAYELLQLYVHKDGHNEQGQQQGAKASIKTRFVITMNMSRLGPIQLDGLSQKRQLDLVIRSENPLPETLTASLRETAVQSLEAVGLIGTLTIQSGRQNWMTFEDKKAQPSDVVM